MTLAWALLAFSFVASIAAELAVTDKHIALGVNVLLFVVGAAGVVVVGTISVIGVL